MKSVARLVVAFFILMGIALFWKRVAHSPQAPAPQAPRTEVAPSAVPSVSVSSTGMVSPRVGGALFRSDQEPSVKARAEEVLKQKVGVQKEFPLEVTSVRTGDLSAQVFYQQTFQGMRVLPGGTVKVDLGADGKVLSFSSDYNPNLIVRGQFKLTDDEAKTRALMRLGTLQVAGGARVIWAASGEGVPAFIFSDRGREVVIHGETGEVLNFRNRRQY